MYHDLVSVANTPGFPELITSAYFALALETPEILLRMRSCSAWLPIRDHVTSSLSTSPTVRCATVTRTE